jgi:hypothetical protein
LSTGSSQQLCQTDQRFRVRDTFTVDPAERAMEQAPAHLPFAFIEAPVGEMLGRDVPEAHRQGRRGTRRLRRGVKAERAYWTKVQYRPSNDGRYALPWPPR